VFRSRIPGRGSVTAAEVDDMLIACAELSEVVTVEQYPGKVFDRTARGSGRRVLLYTSYISYHIHVTVLTIPKWGSILTSSL
jgi:hypothetical protein